MKLKFILIFLALSFLGNAQSQNLRKAILKSDLIISFNHYQQDTLWVNDFTSKVYIKMDPINEQNSWIYKNNLGSVPKKLSLRKMVDGEDFYSYLITDRNACLLRDLEGGKTYHDLFFIKKDKKEYKIVALYQSLEWEQLKKYEQQIKSLASIEKVKNENESYQKSLDWFIENGLMPDDDFVDYYTKKQLIKESIVYTENQYAKAVQEFKSGKEELFPMLHKKYFGDVKMYYLQKMEEIVRISERDFYDYRAFSEAVEKVTNNFDNNTESVNYLLNNSLTGDKFESYEKTDIMKHLMEVVKDWELKNK